MKVKVNAKEMVVGCLWWRKHKAEYLAGEEGEEAQILTLEGEQKPSGPFFEAFKSLISHKPSKAPLLALAQSCKSITRADCIIMLRGFMLLNPGSNNDSYHLMLEVMRAVVRLRLHETYPDLVGACFRKFDMVLVQAMAKLGWALGLVLRQTQWDCVLRPCLASILDLCPLFLLKSRRLSQKKKRGGGPQCRISQLLLLYP